MQVTAAPTPRTFDSDEARLASFAEALDALHARVRAEVGAEDLATVRRLHRFSRVMEVTGRGLLHFSVGPVSWTAGVLALWVHKQLQATEIGHTVLHGAYDKIPGDHPFQSKTWTWHTPIDERSWHVGHNVRHHQYTNVVGRDPDVRYGMTRLNADVEWRPHHEHQHLHTLGAWLGFGFFMNAHFSGLVDVWTRRTDDHDFVDPRDPEAVRGAYRAALRKWIPYYGKELVLFPALAGAGWWKVALGNMAAEVLRDVYSAVTIFCGHIGEDVRSYPEGTKAGGRARWYAMQVESANDFEVPLPVSILCGGLDRQIEHHLFPRLPPPRLRQIAPEVRRICAEHGVEYKTDTWGGTLRKVFRELRRLSRPEARPRRPARTRPPVTTAAAA